MISSVVEDALIPILFSNLPIENPGKLFSTMKADIPFVPLLLSVIANIMKVSATPPFVMNIFDPFNI
ncbi:hypothetical protein D3C73_1336210 [compost metagenome]